jgi:nucleotide-binding universal stress UspA family protein
MAPGAHRGLQWEKATRPRAFARRLAMDPSADRPIHILLTTDGSEASYRAIAPTCELARRMQGRITFLRIVPELTAIPDTGFATPMGILHRTAEAEVEAARAEMLAALPRFQGLPVDLELERAESAAAGIVHYAHDHRADLIAMASHGRTGLRRILLGSTAEAVLRQARVPVLIFPLQGA